MKVGLVLGGGGARGYAHAGVLRALEELGFEVVAIAGCSIGAIVGAAYAAGLSPEEIHEKLREAPVLQFLDFGSMGGLLGGKGIEQVLRGTVPETFGALNIPLSVTTVDVQRGELVVLHQGELLPALRASSALPGIFSPIEHLGRVFIDGGLLNNLPVDVIRSMTLEPVIAVDVAAPPNRPLDFERKNPVVRMGKGLSDIVEGRIKTMSDVFKRSLTIELFMKSFDVPQAVLTSMRLAMHPPQLLIRPPLRLEFGVEDFDRVDEGVEVGYEAGREALESFLQDPTEALQVML